MYGLPEPYYRRRTGQGGPTCPGISKRFRRTVLKPRTCMRFGNRMTSVIQVDVVAAGVTVKLGGQGSKLAFLGAEAGFVSDTVTVHYTDGSTSTASLGFPNWCCTDPTAYGAQVAFYRTQSRHPVGAGQLRHPLPGLLQRHTDRRDEDHCRGHPARRDADPHLRHDPAALTRNCPVPVRRATGTARHRERRPRRVGRTATAGVCIPG